MKKLLVIGSVVALAVAAVNYASTKLVEHVASQLIG